MSVNSQLVRIPQITEKEFLSTSGVRAARIQQLVYNKGSLPETSSFLYVAPSNCHPRRILPVVSIYPFFSAFFIFLIGAHRMASVVKRAKKAATDVDQSPVAVEAKPKRTRKVVAEPRVKLYWGVFNQNLKRVAVFEYDDVKKAEKHAKELSKEGSDHFLQKIKEVVT
jgi:hypothetical protein